MLPTIRIHRDDAPDGVWINQKDFDPNIHQEWADPIPELPQTVEIAGLQEPIAADPPKKTTKKTIRIHRDDAPDGVWINQKDFDPNIHQEWADPIPELPQTVEIAGLQEPIAADPPKKTTKKKVV